MTEVELLQQVVNLLECLLEGQLKGAGSNLGTQQLYEYIADVKDAGKEAAKDNLAEKQPMAV